MVTWIYRADICKSVVERCFVLQDDVGIGFGSMRYKGREVRSIMDYSVASNQGMELFTCGVVIAVAKMSMSGI